MIMKKKSQPEPYKPNKRKAKCELSECRSAFDANRSWHKYCSEKCRLRGINLRVSQALKEFAKK